MCSFKTLHTYAKEGKEILPLPFRFSAGGLQIKPTKDRVTRGKGGTQGSQ